MIHLLRLLSLLLLAIPGATAADENIVNKDLNPPGQIVDIGGHRMHIHCQGKGQPTVILDSGAGGFSLEWIKIQNAISSLTRVCAYDRSGYGWSDMGPLPRTSKRLVDELHRLLFKAKVPGPYILVGHSFGGYVARYYASVYPKEMAGLVLIESSHPEQVERLPQNKRNSKTQYPPHSRTYNVSHPVMHEHYPVQARANAYHLMSSWKYKFTQREEMLSLPHSAKEVQGAEPLPNIPLVVLTRGKRVWPNNDYGDEMEKIWMEMQDELALLNEGAIHLIAERSGHSIHLDQPEFVISALRVLLNNQGSTPSHSKQEGY